jgi:hypothetical protein
MRYRLRTLLILLLVGPPLLAGWVRFDRDPFQLFLAFGFIAYFLFALAVGWVVANCVDVLKKLL